MIAGQHLSFFCFVGTLRLYRSKLIEQQHDTLFENFCLRISRRSLRWLLVFDFSIWEMLGKVILNDAIMRCSSFMSCCLPSTHMPTMLWCSWFESCIQNHWLKPCSNVDIHILHWFLRLFFTKLHDVLQPLKKTTEIVTEIDQKSKSFPKQIHTSASTITSKRIKEVYFI